MNDGRVLVAAAVAGHAIILQPEFMVRKALASGALTPLLADYAAPTRTLYLLHASCEPQPTMLRAFVDHLATAFAAGP